MFQNLSPITIDPLFELWNEYQSDPNPNKQNLGIGIYTDEKGQSYVMPSIQKASRAINTTNFDYISMNGERGFLTSTGKLVLGELFDETQIALQQTCGGTHALKIYADLAQKDGYTTCLFPEPTWPNHINLFQSFEHKHFPHLTDTYTIDINSYQKALQQADSKSMLILQGGPTHNPCGLNLSLSDLEKILPLIQEKNIAICIDLAYLGLGENIEKDRETVQYLWKHVEKIAIAVSFSKNGCLYRQRTGALLIKTDSPSHVEAHEQVIIRESISNPPAFGAEVMNTCLNTFFDQWNTELKDMRDSINQRRQKLLKLLPESYQYLQNTKGMFGILPIKDQDITTLREQHGIYLPSDKRINFSGLQTNATEYIANALKNL